MGSLKTCPYDIITFKVSLLSKWIWDCHKIILKGLEFLGSQFLMKIFFFFTVSENRINNDSPGKPYITLEIALPFF